MIAEPRPLSDVTGDAIHLLYRELGIVNTLRFIRQFTNGLGNYTEERAELFGEQTLDDLLGQIEQQRKLQPSAPKRLRRANKASERPALPNIA